MDGVRGDLLRLQHRNSPAAVKEDKNQKLSFFNSSDNINEKKIGHATLLAIHYTNMPMRYAKKFKGCKNDNF